MAAAYLADQSDTRAAAARRASASLTARLADLREGVRQAEESVERYKFQHNTVATPGQLVSLATNEALVGLRDLERNVEASRAVYQSFLVRARQTGEEATLDRTNARVISRAMPPLSRSWPPRGLLLALSLIAGLGLGAAWRSSVIFSMVKSIRAGRFRVFRIIQSWKRSLDLVRLPLSPSCFAGYRAPVLARRLRNRGS